MGTTTRLETPAFTIEAGAVTKEAGGSRTVLKFAAAAKRHVDGGFEVNNVRAVMYEKDGRFIAKRTADNPRPVLANRAAWVHEIPGDQLAAAGRFAYDIEYKFDVRRKLVAGELPSLPAESDANDYYRWLSFDPRTLEDRTAKWDIGLWARSSEIVVTYGHTPKLVNDSFRCEYELDLLDADSLVVASRNFTGYLHAGLQNFDDASISLDRRTMRTLKFFELRVRTEVRALATLDVTGL